MEQNIIQILSTDDYYMVKKDIDKLINNSNFLQEIVKVHSPLVFDRFIKMCEYKMDTSVLYESRKKFIKKTLFNLNKDNIYNFFELNNYDKSRQDIIANRYLSEYIVYYYFGDNYYNFMTNLYQMLTYVKYNNNDLISKENIALYEEFVELRKMSKTDMISFFKILLDNDIMSMFYDDINIVRETSHKALVDESLRLNHNLEIYQSDISKRVGVDVYYLDGEQFYGFVRCFAIKKGDLTDHSDYIFSKRKRLGDSFSYIGDKNIGTTDYDRESVTLFYDKINYKNIMYVHHADLHSKRMKEQDDYLSEKENEILTPSELIARTNNYNEIYVKHDENGIMPTALVCYDSISNNDIAFADKYNLAILLINTKKYQWIETFDDDYMENTYVI